MKEIKFDSGIEELMVNGRGPMRFNPSDPNLYGRFFDAMDTLQAIEKEYNQQVEALDNANTDDKGFSKSGKMLNLMKRYDQQMKTVLAEVFGQDNDFDYLLNGINIMAYGSNGERIITNFLNALMPIIQAGTDKHRADAAAEAVVQAKQRRAQREVQK